MTYKQIRDDTLRLLGRYSTAGAVIDESYNNQADYLDRIPSLVDDAQMLIATTVRPIPELYPLQLWLGKKQDGWLHFQLPEDFYRLSGRGLAVVRDGEFSRSHEFHLLGGTGLLVPEGLFGTVTLEYFRYPPPPRPGAGGGRAAGQHARHPRPAALLRGGPSGHGGRELYVRLPAPRVRGAAGASAPPRHGPAPCGGGRLRRVRL